MPEDLPLGSISAILKQGTSKSVAPLTSERVLERESCGDHLTKVSATAPRIIGLSLDFAHEQRGRGGGGVAIAERDRKGGRTPLPLPYFLGAREARCGGRGAEKPPPPPPNSSMHHMEGDYVREGRCDSRLVDFTSTKKQGNGLNTHSSIIAPFTAYCIDVMWVGMRYA